MLHVIYNKDSGDLLRTLSGGVGCYKTNYKSESAAKAALTRLDKKGKLGSDVKFVSRINEHGVKVSDRFETPYVKEDFVVATGDAYRDVFPIKMVERVNLMSGKTYMEADNTPNHCSPASEAYWSM